MTPIKQFRPAPTSLIANYVSCRSDSSPPPVRTLVSHALLTSEQWRQDTRINWSKAPFFEYVSSFPSPQPHRPHFFAVFGFWAPLCPRFLLWVIARKFCCTAVLPVRLFFFFAACFFWLLPSSPTFLFFPFSMFRVIFWILILPPEELPRFPPVLLCGRESISLVRPLKHVWFFLCSRYAFFFTASIQWSVRPSFKSKPSCFLFPILERFKRGFFPIRSVYSLFRSLLIRLALPFLDGVGVRSERCFLVSELLAC